MKITQNQFEDLEFFVHMFELHAETINDLCKTERSDIEYGFTLGSTYNDLRRHFMDFNNLLLEIRATNYEEDDKNKVE